MHTASVISILWLQTVAAGPGTGTELLARGIAGFDAGSRRWQLPAMTNAAALFEAAGRSDPGLRAAHYWRAAAEFHVALMCGAPGGGTPAGQALDRAAAAVERLLAMDAQDAEGHALLSTILGLRIAAAPLTALWRGRSLVRHRDLALRNHPRNPRVYYLLGASACRATTTRLGGKPQGLAYLLDAERLYEEESALALAPYAPRWGRDHCLALIGRTYQELGEPAKAAEYFRKALSINPEHRLAREGLTP